MHHLDEDDDTSAVHNKKELAEYRHNFMKESGAVPSRKRARKTIVAAYSICVNNTDSGDDGAIHSTIVRIRNNSSMYGVASSGGRDHYWRRPLVICSVLSVCA